MSDRMEARDCLLAGSEMVASPGTFASEVLPYGVYSIGTGARRLGVAWEEGIIDLGRLANADAFDLTHLLAADSLNPLLSAGPEAWEQVRSWLLGHVNSPGSQERLRPHLVSQEGATMHLPFHVADYVDFYSSRHHAETVGRLFRPDGAALPPSWLSLPIGYHGRAGTVIVSGTQVERPMGQIRLVDGEIQFGPTRALDIEAEVGFVVGQSTEPGTRLNPADFSEHVFGVVLVNDWSARDIQAWEYVPLGPFLGKSFATSISPWVVPLAALEPARTTAKSLSPEVLPHLVDTDRWNLDITLEIIINGVRVSTPPFADMYWSPGQQLAHMTSNGSALRSGDLFASGTVSGPGARARGCLLELTLNGATPISIGNDTTITYLRDGDTVTICARARTRAGNSLWLGEVVGRVAPPRS